MIGFRYPVSITSASKSAPNETGYVAAFPDVPEAHAQGESVEEVIGEASDALVAALGGYVELRRPIPAPSRPKRSQRLIDLAPLIAAKLALYQAMHEAGVSRVGLGKKLGLSEGAVRRLLDLDHRSHIGQIDAALATIGKRLVVQVDNAA